MRDFPSVVISRLNDFSESQKRAYFEEFDRKKKSVFIAYLLLIPLGWHYAYLNKWGLQALCILSAWGLLLWWVIDWFRVSSLVRDYNKDLSIKLLNNFNWISKKNQKLLEKKSSDMEEWLNTNKSTSLNDFYRLKK